MKFSEIFNEVEDTLSVESQENLINGYANMVITEEAFSLAAAYLGVEDLYEAKVKKVQKPESDKVKDLKKDLTKTEEAALKSLNKQVEIIKRNNLNVFVGCNLRFTKPYEIIKKKIYSKNLGKINYVMIKSSLNIIDYHSYEDYKKSYTSNKKLGGGINFTSIHEIDLILNLFDKTSIYFSLSEKISNLKIDVNDFSTSVFKTSIKKNKFLTLLTMDHFQVTKERYLKIIFEKGEIMWDIIKNSIVITKKNSKKTIHIKNNHNKMYLDEMKYFLNFVKNKKKIGNSYNHINGIKCLKTSIKINSNFKK